MDLVVGFGPFMRYNFNTYIFNANHLMPDLTHKITIISEHQPHLEVLNIHANVGDVVIWADIKKAYKKYARTLHPDNNGSKDAFSALSNAFKALDNLWDNSNHQNINLSSLQLDMDSVSKSIRGLSNKTKEEFEHRITELRDSGSVIPPEFKINIDGMEVSCITDVDAYLKAKRAQEREYKLTVLGYVAFALGVGVIGSSCIGLMTGKSQSNASQNFIIRLCGTGLIAGGGFLIMNSFFKSSKNPDVDNNPQNTEQETEQESLVNTGPFLNG